MIEAVSMTEVYFVRHAEPDLSIHDALTTLTLPL